MDRRTVKGRGGRGRPSRRRGSRETVLPSVLQTSVSRHPPNLATDSQLAQMSTSTGRNEDAAAVQVNNEGIQVAVDNTGNTPGSEDIQEIQRENRQLTEMLNEFKKRLKESEDNFLESESNLKAMRLAFETVENANKKLEPENNGLKKTNQDIVSRTIENEAKKGGRVLEKLTNTVPKQMLGIALKIESEIGKWAFRETCELVIDSPFPLRNWKGRSETTDNLGITTQQGTIVYPYNPIEVATQGGYYLPSCQNPLECLRENSKAEIENEEWNTVFPTEENRVEALNLITSNSILHTKMKQSLSDSCSTRKRQARDHLFLTLNYSKLISRFQSSTDTETDSKTVEIDIAKERLRRKIPGTDTYDFGWWRTATRKELQRYQTQYPVPETSTPGAEDCGNFLLFRDKEFLKTYHLFIGFVPNNSGVFVETSITSLARVDAWINCVVELLIPHEKRGGHRQRMYGDAFLSMLRLSTMQLVGSFYAYVKKWNGWELDSPIIGDDIDTRKKKVMDMTREATVVMRCPSSNQYFLSIADSWFQEYISKDLGHVCDCYIASISEDFVNIHCIGTVSATTTVSLFDAVTPDSYNGSEEEDQIENS